MSKFVMIDAKELANLLTRDELLTTAECWGVDNWCGWGEWDESPDEWSEEDVCSRYEIAKNESSKEDA